MENKYRKLLPLFYTSDLLVKGFAFLLIYSLRFASIKLVSPYSSLFIIILSLWIVLSFIFKTYHEYRGDSLITSLQSLVIAQVIFLLGLSLYIFFTGSFTISRSFFFLFIFLDTALLVTVHMGRYAFINWYRNQKKILEFVVLGKLPEQDLGSRFKIAKQLDLQNSSSIEIALKKEFKSANYDILLITSPGDYKDNLETIIDIARRYGLQVSLLPKFMNSRDYKYKMNYSNAELPVIDIKRNKEIN